MEKEYLYVILAGILSGTIVFAGKIFSNLGLSLFEISTLPFILVTLIMLPFMFFKKYRPNPKLIKIWLFYGLICALLVLSQFAAVVLGVPVTLVVLLLYTQPLWTFIFSKIFMKEKITKLHIFSGFLVIIGVVIMVNPFTIGEIHSWLGVIIALFGGIFLSGWIMIGSYASKIKNHPIAIKFAETFFMLLFLALLYPLIRLITTNPAIISFSFNWPMSTWFYLLLFAVFSQIINHIFYFKGVRKVPTPDAGIILLLEPISAAILSSLFLKQPITLSLVIGGCLILIANYLTITKGKLLKSVLFFG